MVISKTQDSLLILATLAGSIEEYFRILQRESNDKTSIVYAAICGQVLLQACSFKQEWKIFSAILEDKDRINRVRKKTEHFTKKINQWTDLEKVRNTFIAHNYRDSSNKYLNRLLEPFSQELNVPDRFPDYILLCGCINFIFKILQDEFHTEFQDLLRQLKNRKKQAVKKGINTNDEAIKELQSIIEKSDLKIDP